MNTDQRQHQQRATNPYASPEADLAPMGATDMAYGGHPQLASRGLRLGAFLLDGVIWVAAWVFFFFMFGFLSELLGSMAAAGAIIPVLGVLGVNLYMLADNGQTVGKRALGIKIVRSDLVSRASLLRIIFLRIVPVWVVSNIPCVGTLGLLGNYVAIFGGERKCGHDYVADTHVVVDDGQVGRLEQGPQGYITESNDWERTGDFGQHEDLRWSPGGDDGYGPDRGF